MNDDIDLCGVTGIYALLDPADETVGYVGKSIDIAARYRQHITTHDGTQKSLWIKRLLENGQKPKIKLLERCHNDNLDDRETYWMSFFMEAGESAHNVSKKTKAHPKRSARELRTTIRFDVETVPLLEALAFMHGLSLSDTLTEIVWRHVNDHCKDSFDLFKVMSKKRGIDFHSELATRIQ